VSDNNTDQICLNLSELTRLQGLPHRLIAVYLRLVVHAASISDLEILTSNSDFLNSLSIPASQGRAGFSYKAHHLRHDLKILEKLRLIKKIHNKFIMQTDDFDKHQKFVEKSVTKCILENSIQQIDLKKENTSIQEKSITKSVTNIVSEPYNNSLYPNSLYVSANEEKLKPISENYCPSENLFIQIQNIPDCPDPSDPIELSKFIAHHQSKGSKSANWDAAYRYWLIKGAEYNRKLKEKTDGACFKESLTRNKENDDAADKTRSAAFCEKPNRAHNPSNSHRYGGFDDFMAGLRTDLRSDILDVLRPTTEFSVVQSIGRSDEA
jgi:predicted transcriptional regulator